MEEVVFEHISKFYGSEENGNFIKAIDDVSFTIPKGQFVVILGNSGAGKSTMLNILGGMDKASKGKYYINGEEVTSKNDHELGVFRRRDIGFVFQFYNLMPNLTALENIILAASIVENSFDPKEMIKKVGLEGREGNFPSQLSGGEQQRVAIARAIVKNPPLLLCDEPTGALDSKTGGMIIKLLVDICQEFKKTVIVVSHNAKIAKIADRIIRVRDGKIVSDELNKDKGNPLDIEW